MFIKRRSTLGAKKCINQKKKKLAMTYLINFSIPLLLYLSHCFDPCITTSFSPLFFLPPSLGFLLFLEETERRCVCVSCDVKEKEKCREYFLF